jgi:hypothetical protein
MAGRKHSRKEVLALRAKRHTAREAVTQYQNPHQVLSIPQWCALNNYSVIAGRKKLMSGEGPPLLKLSERRYGVRVGDDIAWKEALAKAAGG